MTDAEYYGIERAREISAKISKTITGVRKGVWVTNGTQNKVVFEADIPAGWTRGRTQKGYTRRKKDFIEVQLRLKD